MKCNKMVESWTKRSVIEEYTIWFDLLTILQTKPYGFCYEKDISVCHTYCRYWLVLTFDLRTAPRLASLRSALAMQANGSHLSVFKLL